MLFATHPCTLDDDSFYMLYICLIFLVKHFLAFIVKPIIVNTFQDYFSYCLCDGRDYADCDLRHARYRLQQSIEPSTPSIHSVQSFMVIQLISHSKTQNDLCLHFPWTKCHETLTVYEGRFILRKLTSKQLMVWLVSSLYSGSIYFWDRLCIIDFP